MRNRRELSRGFTILEILTATVILAMIPVMVFSVLNHSIGASGGRPTQISTPSKMRGAVFDITTARLSGATLEYPCGTTMMMDFVHS